MKVIKGTVYGLGTGEMDMNVPIKWDQGHASPIYQSSIIYDTYYQGPAEEGSGAACPTILLVSHNKENTSQITLALFA